MDDLTLKEKEIYQYICECMEKNGYAPSVRDICASLNIKSTSSVHGYLRRLEMKGYIKKSSGKSRALTIESDKKNDSVKMERVPILGKVTAGVPILALENQEGPIAWEGDPNCFALRVRGDSMMGAAILDGDMVVVRPQQNADDGQIVVARIGDEATVKRFYKENGHSFLKYVIELRMNRACALLTGTSLSVKEIAESVGYPDQLYFSRIFKNRFEMTPSEYRVKKKRRRDPLYDDFYVLK